MHCFVVVDPTKDRMECALALPGSGNLHRILLFGYQRCLGNTCSTCALKKDRYTYCNSTKSITLWDGSKYANTNTQISNAATFSDSFLCSHITRTTQWEDPRKQLQAQQNLVAHQSADSLLRSPQQAQPQQPTLAQQQGEICLLLCASLLTAMYLHTYVRMYVPATQYTIYILQDGEKVPPF